MAELIELMRKTNMLRIVGSCSLDILKFGIKMAEKANDANNQLDAFKEALNEVLDSRNKVAAAIAFVYNTKAFNEKLDNAKMHLEAVRRWACRAWPNAGGVAVVDARLVEGSRLLVGGSSGILQALFEVGMSWDYVLDLPYIPGSSLKGAMRASAEALLGKDYKDILYSVFGPETESKKKFAGCLEVFDAYPVEAPRGLLDVDVITPHYYKGGEVRSSELEVQPMPIAHVSVAPGTVFRFVVAHRCPNSVLQQLSRALRERLKIHASGAGALATLLGMALFNGIGARTGKSYGVFTLERVSFECPGG